MAQQTAYGRQVQRRAEAPGSTGAAFALGALNMARSIVTSNAVNRGVLGGTLRAAGALVLGALGGDFAARRANSYFGAKPNAQRRAINILAQRAAQERRARAAAVNGYATVRGHYAQGHFVRQHRRRIG